MIVVMPSGLDEIYPKSNLKQAERIVENRVKRCWEYGYKKYGGFAADKIEKLEE